MKKINVLIFGLSTNKGGIESYVYNTLKHIDRDKIQFDFIDVSDYDQKLAFCDEFKTMGCNIYKVCKRTKNYFKSIKDIKKILIENNYDYIHFHIMNFMWWEPILLASKYTKSKIILHSHNSMLDKKSYLRNVVMDTIGRFLTRNVEYLKLACGNDAGKYLFKKKKFIVMENGIYIDKFLFSEKNRSIIRSKYDIPEDCIVFGHVGNFYIAKNYPKLISIFNEYHKLNCNSKLILIGNYNNDLKIKGIVEKLKLDDSVIFTGIQNNVNEYYSAFDLFVFPSLYEGLSISMIEAQISGLYCFASNTIDKNTKITDNYQVIDIDDKSSSIAKLILETNLKYNRKDIDFKKEYNIKNSSEKLQMFYERNM